MQIHRATSEVAEDCIRILRTLPLWFGHEESLIGYAKAADRFPTFVCRIDGKVVAFLTIQEHFSQSWEVHCIAVQAAARGQGLGRKLHTHVEGWLEGQGARLLQVKTVAAEHPSPEYAQTRGFYTHLGYVPLEVFRELWGPEIPVLQLVKVLGVARNAA